MEPSINDFGRDGIIDQVPEKRMKPMIELLFHPELLSFFLHISFPAFFFFLADGFICAKPVLQSVTNRFMKILI